MRDEIRLEDIRLSLIVLWKKRNLVIAYTLIMLVIGWLITLRGDTRNIYRADATVYSATTGSYQQSVNGTNAMKDYVDIVTSNKVCERALMMINSDSVNVELIQSMVSARFNNDSNILNVYGYSSNPEMAIQVANAIAEAYVVEMRGISGNEGIKMLDEADKVVISENGKANLAKKRILFVMAGFVVSCLVIVVRELFSDKVKSINQCISDSENEILGVIPNIDLK